MKKLIMILGLVVLLGTVVDAEPVNKGVNQFKMAEKIEKKIDKKVVKKIKHSQPVRNKVKPIKKTESFCGTFVDDNVYFMYENDVEDVFYADVAEIEMDLPEINVEKPVETPTDVEVE